MADPMLRWFEPSWYRDEDRPMVRAYRGVAIEIVAMIRPSAERDVALRELLNSLTAATRAAAVSRDTDEGPQHIENKDR